MQAPQSDVAVQPGVYDFTDDALALAAQFDSNLSGWDPFITGLEALASDPLEDLLDGTVDALVTATGLGIAQAALPSIDSVVTAYGLADSQLNIAIAFAPVQAWADPPAPFIPPGNVLNITPPAVPAGAFTPGNYLPASASVPGAPTVTLLNLTRGGQNNFVVGDQFSVVGTGGTPGQAVTVDGVQNGQDFGVSAWATLDGTGSFASQGTMAPGNKGAWQEYWYFDGVLVAQLNFIVTEGNAA
jgi:hypothetical protein